MLYKIIVHTFATLNAYVYEYFKHILIWEILHSYIKLTLSDSVPSNEDWIVYYNFFFPF